MPGATTSSPEAGDDQLPLGIDDDFVNYSQAPNGVLVDLRLGEATGQGRDTLDSVEGAHGSLFGDSLLGANDGSTLIGRGGNDFLQGGNAALWTGVLADDYAPELTIDGVAALAPASDLVPLAQPVQGAAAGTVVTAYYLTACANTYDDVDLEDYVRPGATVTVRKAAERCLTDPGLAASLIAASGAESVFSTDLSGGPLGERLRENTPTADMTMPLVVAGGTADEVINIAINEAWVAQQCDAGYNLDFRTYPDRTHMGVLDQDSPLTAWTEDRFAGSAPESGC